MNKRLFSYILLFLAAVFTMFLYSKLSLDNWFYQDRKVFNKDEILEAMKHKALFFDTDILRIDYEDGQTISLKGDQISIDDDSLMNVKDFTLELAGKKLSSIDLNATNAIYDPKKSMISIKDKAYLSRELDRMKIDGVEIDLAQKTAFSKAGCSYDGNDMQITSSNGFAITQKQDYEFTLYGAVQFTGNKGEKIILISQDVDGILEKETGALKLIKSKNAVQITSDSYVATASEWELKGDSMVVVLKNNLVITSKDGNIKADRLEYDVRRGKTKIFGSEKKRLKVKVYDAKR